MPTGYTEIIERDGPEPTFRDFAIRCARGMGACVMQRDESLDVAPRHRELSDYHIKELAKASARWRELDGMTLAQAAVIASAEHEAMTREWRDGEEVRIALMARYARMRTAVVAWKAPTPVHEGLRRFMLEQIDLCFIRPMEEPTPVDAAAWLLEQKRQAARDIAYHTEEQVKEVTRCTEANAWIDAMMASLPEAR